MQSCIPFGHLGSSSHKKRVSGNNWRRKENIKIRSIHVYLTAYSMYITFQVLWLFPDQSIQLELKVAIPHHHPYFFPVIYCNLI